MSGNTIILAGPDQRKLASAAIAAAPDGSIVKLEGPKRTLAQNARMWAMLTDLSRQRPEGRCYTPETWKCLVMHACGHEVTFIPGLSGEPFPLGFRSSKLTKEQMAELIEWIEAYGAEHGVKFHAPQSMGEEMPAEAPESNGDAQEPGGGYVLRGEAYATPREWAEAVKTLVKAKAMALRFQQDRGADLAAMMQSDTPGEREAAFDLADYFGRLK